jgi:hypothetical protein
MLLGYSSKNLEKTCEHYQSIVEGKIITASARQSEILSMDKFYWEEKGGIVKHNLEASIGQGGSPILIQQDSQLIVVAIHVLSKY